MPQNDAVDKNKPDDHSIQVGDITDSEVVAIGDRARAEKHVHYHYAAWPAPKLGSVPPLPAFVVGREDDLCNLKARLGIAGGGPAAIQVLTAIRGWPGIGKTTIAAVLAHDSEVMAAFPDGVLWTSLGPHPSLFSELATWGRALGTDDLLHAKTLEEATAQLTAMLRNKQMLLIVDDVWQPEHAVPFKVGGRGCAMLVTTRVNSVAQALAPTANDIYRLPVLTDDKSLELLEKLAPSVVAGYRDQCLVLVKELEGLPLALQVAGHMLNVEAGYGFGVTDLLAELREGAKLLEAKAPADRTDLANETTPTIAVLLQRSTERLDDLTRDCYAYLGVFAPKPATFDLAAMKAVWQIEDPKPIARTLVDRGLLEPAGSGRFQMHSLLLLHAESLLAKKQSTPTLREVYLQHAKHYCTILHMAEELYMQGGEGLTRGLDLFDSEWINIQAGQVWATENTPRDKMAAQLCSDYPDVGLRLLHLRQRMRDRIRWRESALVAAQYLKSRGAEGAHLGNLGLAYAEIGEPRRAIELYNQSLSITREVRDRRGEAAVLGNLGNAHADIGEVKIAVGLYEQQLTIASGIADREGEANALGSLGRAYAALGDIHHAIEFYNQSLVIHRAMGDLRSEGIMLNELGNALANLGTSREAIKYYEQALTIARVIGDRRTEAGALGNLGGVWADLNEHRRAIEFYQKSLIIHRETENRNGEANVLMNIGNSYLGLGIPKSSKEYLEQAIQIFRAIGDRRGESQALGNIGGYFVYIGDNRQARVIYEQRLALARELDDRHGEALALMNIAIVHNDLGDSLHAVDLHEQALTIFRDIGDQYSEGNTLCNMSLAFNKLNNREKAIACAKAALKIYEQIESPMADIVRKQLSKWGENKR